jgi:hypothetical protein
MNKIVCASADMGEKQCAVELPSMQVQEPIKKQMRG